MTYGGRRFLQNKFALSVCPLVVICHVIASVNAIRSAQCLSSHDAIFSLVIWRGDRYLDRLFFIQSLMWHCIINNRILEEKVITVYLSVRVSKAVDLFFFIIDFFHFTSQLQPLLPLLLVLLSHPPSLILLSPFQGKGGPYPKLSNHHAHQFSSGLSTFSSTEAIQGNTAMVKGTKGRRESLS